MAEADEYLARKMSRAELNLLSEDEKRERKMAQIRINSRKYREGNPEKYKENGRKFREENPEKVKEINRKSSNKYRENNPEKVKEKSKKFRENNPEYFKEYSQTPAGQKAITLSSWKNNLGLEEPREEMERIYELRETQELCSSCGCKLTRTGNKCSTDASMDHCHITNRFRQICCKKCNDYDNWKKFWVDGIYGGSRTTK